METEGSIVLFTREQLKARVRADLADRDLVGSLLAERRRAAQVEEDAEVAAETWGRIRQIR